METLLSIQNQSYQNWECICVDDGSTDNTKEIIEDFAEKDNRFKLFARPHELIKGGNSCRNYGFTLATGEFIQWFDSDDIMHQDKLRDKVYYLQMHSSLNYVISKTVSFLPNSEDYIESNQHLDTNNAIIDFVNYKTKFFTPGPLFRREFLQGERLFDIELKRHQEYEFFFRLILKDDNYGFVDKAHTYRRVHHNQLSKASKGTLQKRILSFMALEKMYLAYASSTRKNKELERYFIRKFKSQAFRFSLSFKLSKALKATSYLYQALNSSQK
ncbi:glycosyltransferase family 2 protein [Pontibacter sp. HSC-14F20]|nr:glycosyltransferase family 2 protein [Pontibacter sp. HSC-14F20]